MDGIEVDGNGTVKLDDNVVGENPKPTLGEIRVEESSPIDELKVGGSEDPNTFDEKVGGNVNALGEDGHSGDHEPNIEAASNPFKFSERQSWVSPKKDQAEKAIVKRPFLKKGAGTARFYRGSASGRGDSPSVSQSSSNASVPLTASSSALATQSIGVTSSANSRSKPKDENDLAKPTKSEEGPRQEDVVTSPRSSTRSRPPLPTRNLKNSPSPRVNSPRPSLATEMVDDPYLELSSSYEGSAKSLFIDEDDGDKNSLNPNSPIKVNALSKYIQDEPVPFGITMSDIDSDDDDEDMDYIMAQVDKLVSEDDEELQEFELLEKMTKEERSPYSPPALLQRFLDSRRDLPPRPKPVLNISGCYSSNLVPSLGLSRNSIDSCSMSSGASSASPDFKKKLTDDQGSKNSYSKLSPVSKNQGRPNTLGSYDSNAKNSAESPLAWFKRHYGEYCSPNSGESSVTPLLKNIDHESEKSAKVLEEVAKLNNKASEAGRLENKDSIEFQSALLTARTMELETQIKKLREQLGHAEGFRLQWQEKCAELDEAQERFDHIKERELRLIDDEKERIARKKERASELKKEYKAKCEEYKVGCIEYRCKSGYEEEVQNYKNTINGLEKELKWRCNRATLTQNKLKDEIKILQDENNRLQAEIDELTSDRGSHGTSKPEVVSTSTNTPPIQGTKKPETASASTNTAPDQSSKKPETVSTSTNTPPSKRTRKPQSPDKHSKKSEEEFLYQESLPDDETSSPVSSQNHGGSSATGSSGTTNVKKPLRYDTFTKTYCDDGVESEETILPNGDQETKYSNGTVRTVTAGSPQITRTQYYNGDIRITREGDETIKYFYHDSSVWHTSFPSGEEFIQYPNGQFERRNADGILQITYANGSVKHIYPCGKAEHVFLDQTILRTERNGDKVLILANGQKEYQTKDYRKRCYPDGTVKILYSDGTVETRYANGRVRMKNARGELIHDAIHPIEAGKHPQS